MGGKGPYLITLHRRGSGLVLRVDYACWGQTPEDLRHLALSAPHARTRERALALFDITQHRCATQVALRTGRRAHTVLGWVHAANQGGPDALAFRRTGRRPPLFSHTANPNPATGAPRRVGAPRPRRRPSFFPPPRDAPPGGGVRAAPRRAPPRPTEGADPARRGRWRRWAGGPRGRWGLVCCRETPRGALPRRKLS